MSTLIRHVHLPPDREARTRALLQHEWLVTNGLGGYASNSLAGVPTRRYHGVLIAALPNPLGRMVMLTELSERVRLSDGTVAQLSGEERTNGGLLLPAVDYVDEFFLELGLPVWRFRIGSVLLEKRVLMPYQQNTVHIIYRLLEGEGAVRLNLRPAMNVRPAEYPVSTPLHAPPTVHSLDDRFEVMARSAVPPLRLRLQAANSAFAIQPRALTERLYRVEKARGYEDNGSLWSPGYFRTDIAVGDEVALVASTEPWSTVDALPPGHAIAAEHERRMALLAHAPERLRECEPELILAADAFLITPAYRAQDVARRRAAGDELRSVIAGYHWFTDWGRDTMIALEGLALVTGRPREAGQILRTFAQYMRAGLIPNMFPEGSSEGRYNTADATLWFFHAIERYVRATNDQKTLRELLPGLREIADYHLRGTEFGIGIDPNDGLLTQGAEGLQLTWMDAKVDGWVVTPRRGKAVELSALWYNALRLLAQWLRESGDNRAADTYAQHAARTRASFNQRFWYEEGGYLFDVIDGADGNDPALRPNQLFAFSLTHPVLEREKWEAVFDVVTKHLLTPYGLRSLAPHDPQYKPTYHGDLRTRDAAYHQGTVWGWLIGPYLDAYLKLHPEDRQGARRCLQPLLDHLNHYGVGTIGEIFDAEPPFTPRGCIAQAWSVAEVLRGWVATEG